MVTQKITTRLSNAALPPVRMVSGDVGREIQLEIYAAEDSTEPINLETYRAAITIIKPDNTFVIQDFTNDKVELPQQAGAVTGHGFYQIKIYTAGDHQIYTGQGSFIVDDDILSDETIESIAKVNGYNFPDDFLTEYDLHEYVKKYELEDAIAGIIDDDETATNSTWSSAKISEALSTVAKTATGNPIEITDGANAPLVKCVTQITGYQEGTGTPSPDNIRPIVAYTEGEIEVRGKNLFGDVLSNSGADFANGEFVNTDTDTFANFRPKIFLYKDGNAVYQLSMDAITSKGLYTANIGYKNASYDEMQFKHDGSVRDLSVNVKLDASGVLTLSFYCESFNPTTVGGIVIKDIQVEKGSATPYEPYTKTNYTAAFSNSIYQGNADFVGGSATAEKILVDLTDYASVPYWTKSTRYAGSFYMGNGAITPTIKQQTPFICTHCETVSYMGSYQKGCCYSDTAINIWLMDGDATVQDWVDYIVAQNAAGTPIKIAVELATPTTSSVTPTNLPIKSLSGYSHIESTTGEMDVEYITQTYDAIMQAAKLDNMKVYGTAEQVVGKWIDGRDIYERTIDIGSFSVSSGGDHTIESSTNINLLIDYAGYMVESNIMYVLPDPSVRIKVDASHNLIFTGMSSWNVTSGYITIRYIKL